MEVKVHKSHSIPNACKGDPIIWRTLQTTILQGKSFNNSIWLLRVFRKVWIFVSYIPLTQDPPDHPSIAKGTSLNRDEACLENGIAENGCINVLIAFSERPLPLLQSLLPFGALRPGQQGPWSLSWSFCSSAQLLWSQSLCWGQKDPTEDSFCPRPPKGCVGSATYLGDPLPFGSYRESHKSLFLWLLLLMLG